MWEAIKRWLRCRGGHFVVPTGRHSEAFAGAWVSNGAYTSWQAITTPLLVQMRCKICGGLFVVNTEEGTMLRWSPSFEEIMDPAPVATLPVARIVKS